MGGLTLDDDRNKKAAGKKALSAAMLALAAYVIPTDEELMIARDTNCVAYLATHQHKCYC